MSSHESARSERASAVEDVGATPAADFGAAEQSGSTESELIGLQQSIGNQAVSRLVRSRIARQSGVGAAGGTLDDETTARIQSRLGGGTRLDPSVQAQMETSLGTAVGPVNVHADGEADRLNSDVNAQAFTVGNDIFFSAGSYQPDTSDGQALLAHELTHVVQHDSSPSSGSMTVSAVDDPAEVEAASVAASAASRSAAPTIAAGPAGPTIAAGGFAAPAVASGDSAGPTIASGAAAPGEASSSPAAPAITTGNSAAPTVASGGAAALGPSRQAGRIGRQAATSIAATSIAATSTAAGSALHRDAPPGSVAAAEPNGVDLSSVRVSFQIPADKSLSGNSVVEKVYTTDPTSVSLQVTATGISVQLSPPVHIRPLTAWANLVPVLGQLGFFGLSDADWSGLEYSFASASVTSVGLADTGPGISIQDSARGSITDLFTSLLAGTPVAVAGYDPLTDPDLTGTMAAIQANAAKGGSGSEVTAEDASNLTFDVTGTFTAPVHEVDDSGSGIDIDGGTSATLEVTMDGTVQDVQDPAKRQIRTVRVTTAGIHLLSGGQRVSNVRSVYVNHGGAVTVGDFDSEGALSTVEGVAGLIGLLVGGVQPHPLGPEGGAVEGMVKGGQVAHAWGRSEIEAAISPKILAFIRDNKSALPGADLAALLGI